MNSMTNGSLPSARLKGAGRCVRLFEADPDLLRRTPRELRDRLTVETKVPATTVPAGPWEPVIPSDRNLVSFFVLEGTLRRETRLFGRRAVEILGPGDVIRPTEGTEWASLPYEPSWKVVARARIALLDERFEAQLCKMPGVAGQLLGRGVQRSRTLEIQLAIVGIHDLRARLLVMLWHLADRWGKRVNGTTVVQLPLPQGLLADLVRASRSRVCTRLGELRRLGLLYCRPDDELWVLNGRAPTALRHLKAMSPIPASPESEEGARP